jgi:hypothetical protein
MTLRILHILDHSLPLHSGYTFRTLSILREQRRLGWETFHLTSPKQGAAASAEETVDGWQFFRTRLAAGRTIRGVDELRLMAATRRRISEVIEKVRPHVVHPHSPVLNALPAISAARKHGLPVVYEMRASWEDAAVDHGTTTEGSLRYRASRALETFALRRADQVTTICATTSRVAAYRRSASRWSPTRSTSRPFKPVVPRILRYARSLDWSIPSCSGSPARFTHTRASTSCSMRSRCFFRDSRRSKCCCWAAVRRTRA